ncbi:Putative peptidase S8 propeptide/proteinase inhibitor I9 [Colletotrichum destructivum]|uniref:Peptidase S8 propeptide/proteinase inhibitor I9 n=1 Tax=Colletotrichum destructivum TaxID=34406 RepID=A0AAX4IWN0_9PEZI|nr:Putative peptidase S8 propeptide/proteinase inhibitor I9 [Colletotrichum destructivum]
MHAATLLALLPLAAVAAPSRRAQPAPLIKPRGGTLVADKYIVRLRNDAGTGAMRTAMAAFAADADHVYNFGGAWRGFSSTLNASEVAALRDDPNVDSVEQDAVVTISATQRNAPWGLARLSSAKPGSTTYSYDESAGDGTCAYIVDTGIDVEHPDFEGRASFLANFADDSDTDGQGHGTHVAGTVGSATYGVAKKTKLFAVKVLDDNGEGTNSGVIAGMDFVVSDVRGGREGCSRGVVVNMSLGGPTSAAVNEAAAAIVQAGHFLAVAAGNEAADASTSSPASEASACTVGATAEDDSLAEYSNFGAVVDILAPGSEIESTWPGGSTDTISGTSMASPHVAGLAAYLLGLGSAPSDPVELCSYIAETALDGVVGQVPRRTVNKLANNGFAGNGTAKVTDGSVVGRQLNTRFAVRS